MENHLPRKLAAILQADVVGYSRLMGKDEAGTLTRLNTHRRELIDPTIEAYHGRIVKLMGDGVLVEFPSVVEAVACAVAIQAGMSGRNEGIPDGDRIELRIGINLGDILVEGDDIHGDGVNVAARLEGLAEPGGVCVSEAVRSAVGEKLPLEYDFMGAQAVKNIEAPVRAYRARLRPGAELPGPSAPRKTKPKRPVAMAIVAAVVVIGSGVLAWLKPWNQQEEITSAEPTEFTLHDKPSIAVLPFANMSGDPEQDYFADGITEDLTTDLSKISGLFVVARNSSFSYKGRSIDVREVSRELGVRYVLEGSVRRVGD